MNRNIYIILSLLFLFSCSKKESNDTTTDEDIANAYCLTYVCPSAAPNIISYSLDNIDITIGDTIPSIKPTYQANYYSIIFRTSKDLPQGFEFNNETGEITGTAEEVVDNKTINIIADNRIFNAQTGTVIAGGIDVYPITFNIKDVPPSNISLVNEEELNYYNATQDENDKPVHQLNLEFERGTSISPLILAFNDGGSPTQYLITPTLPLGLSLGSDGRITGRPLESQTNTLYTIKISNSGGNIELNFNIFIKGRPPENLSYLYPNEIYKAGLDITENNPIYEGDTANNFSIEPALPLGMFINTQTGFIFGNPEEIVSNKDFVVSASNEWGTTTTNIKITVEDYVSDIETGDGFSCGIRNKKVYCWGTNFLNQLGYVSLDTCSNNEESTSCSKKANLVEMDNSENLRAKDLKLTKASSCALAFDKKIYCWGDNSFGQLGNEIVSNSINPLIVKKENDEELTAISNIYSGELFYCALNNLNELYCWGDNTYNQISETGNFISKAKLISSEVEDVFLGFNKLCFKSKVDNQVYCRGRNISNTISSSSNEIINEYVTIKDNLEQNIINIDYMIMGEEFSLLMKEDILYSWGDNSSGSLFNSSSSSSVPITVDDSSLFLDLDKNSYSVGKKDWCFISENLNQCIGFNNNTFSSDTNNNSINTEFVNMESSLGILIPRIDNISSKKYSHRCHSVDGQAFCYGSNSFGSLGDDTTSDSTYSRQVLFNN